MKKRALKNTAAVLTVILAAGALTSCKDSADGAGGDTNIKWYIFDNPSNTNMQEIMDEAAVKIKEHCGAQMTFVPLESGNYEAKMQVLNASAETFDIVFTSNWCNNYYTNVSKNTLTKLDDLLKKTPELYNAIPDYFWTGAKINGSIYAVPNQQIAAREVRFAVPKQNIELLGLDVDKYQSENKDYKQILAGCEDYLIKLKEKSGTYAKLGEIWSDGLTMFNMEEVLGTYLPGAIRHNTGDKITLFNQYESQEFQDYINTRRKWVLEGLVQPEVEDERNYEGIKDKSKVIPSLIRINTYNPGMESDLIKQYKYETEFLINTTPMMSGSSVIATMNGISSTSKNPELALKVIEYVDTDPEIYNLLSFGIEGKNYKKTGDNRIERLPDETYNMANWAVGNTFNSYLLPEQADDVLEETKMINDSAQRSELLGFSPNLDKLKTQISACKSAVDEFFKVLDYGVVDVDTAYPEFINKLKSAGADEIIKEVQAQIDAWQEAN